MEWGKAKTILIVTFLILNMILGYQLWIHSRVTDSYFAQAEARDDMNQLLRSKNIRLEGEISREMPHLREITVTFSEAYNPPEPVELDSPVDAQPILRGNAGKRTEELLPRLDEYAYDPMQSQAGVYVLNQLYDGMWPMFEINLKLFHDNGRITRYEQQYGVVEAEHGEEELQVLSAYKVVSFLAERVLPEGSVIREVRLGYHGQVYDSDIQVLAPKWRITLGNNDVYYVHAINGELE